MILKLFLKEGDSMLWSIFVVILLLWVLGFSFHIAGGLIHILLVIALISLIFNLISGRRSR
ncbi:MAG: family rane protein [Bacilli bacterium]|nr:family rane protein [Bacilli bacterium]